MISAVIGLQYGDQGKGKFVDYLLKDYDVSIRFNGSNNAGHSVSVGDKNYAVHLMPSGIFRNKKCLVANQCVLDPISFCQEIDYIKQQGFTDDNLKIGSRVTLICPFHRYIDKYFEQTSNVKLGTTRRGVGHAYADKMRRIALRMQDCLLTKDEIIQKYNICLQANLSNIFESDLNSCKIEFDLFYECLQKLKRYICDVTSYFHECIQLHENILFEGAQSTQLDLTWGEYPFVTSSSCLAQNAMLSVGYRFNFDKIYGVFKAYTTRVGTGPFITKMTDELDQKTRQIGKQYGVTTGRPRLCGWLDLVALRRSCLLNGVTDLCIVKADVLDGYKVVNACVAYDNGEDFILNRYPFTAQFKSLKPVYSTFAGWQNYKDEKLNKFINFISDFTGVKISYLSFSPKREDVLQL